MFGKPTTDDELLDLIRHQARQVEELRAEVEHFEQPRRAGDRLRRSAPPSYDRLLEAARHSAVQHADETGWKIGSRSAWLWVFADEHATPYRILRGRGHDAAVEDLGDDYQGGLVSNCFLACDPPNLTKSKCAAHLLKRCSEVEATNNLAEREVRPAVILRRLSAGNRSPHRAGPEGPR